MQERPRRGLAIWLLVGVALVWGSTFSVVKAALRDVSPLLFNLLRMVVATVAMVLTGGRRLRGAGRRTWVGGALAGVFLGGGYQLQTAGLARTTAVKSAFLTGLVVVLVPLVSFVPVVRGRAAGRPGWSALAGAATAFAGLFLLATPAGTALSDAWGVVAVGDWLTLGCAAVFAAHLLVLSRLTDVAAEALTTVQIGCATVLMALTLPLGGALRLRWSPALVMALGVTGVVATAAAFSAQTWAQRHLSATTTALLLTLEPVFALVCSVWLLGERLSVRAGAGAALILAGIAVTELLGRGFRVPAEPL